ncbi:MAG: DUF366 family protein [Planctomycetes bacterium]|nr:DUF366 family protein [Planctomycetota bacterium]
MIVRHLAGERIDYDGAALRAHWILARTGIVGDALVAFRGACRVSDAEMADLEDLGGPGIAGDDMLHFVMELFDDASLACGVLRQRLFTVVVAEQLAALGARAPLRRAGDDLWVGDRKLSISIATRSPVSSLLHFAVNVTVAGVPVPAAGIEELGVASDALAEAVLGAWRGECAGIARARAKVRAKGEWGGR